MSCYVPIVLMVNKVYLTPTAPKTCYYQLIYYMYIEEFAIPLFHQQIELIND